MYVYLVCVLKIDLCVSPAHTHTCTHMHAYITYVIFGIGFQVLQDTPGPNTHRYLHARMHTYTHTIADILQFTHACIHICTHTHMQAIHVCMYACVCIVYTHTHTHTHYISIYLSIYILNVCVHLRASVRVCVTGKWRIGASSHA